MVFVLYNFNVNITINVTSKALCWEVYAASYAQLLRLAISKKKIKQKT